MILAASAAGVAVAIEAIVTVPPTGPVRLDTASVSLSDMAAESVIVPSVCVAVADATVTAAETVVVVRATLSAVAGDTDVRTPNPNEATATSAIRL
jgi:acyl-CoA hydrolase